MRLSSLSLFAILSVYPLGIVDPSMAQDPLSIRLEYQVHSPHAEQEFLQVHRNEQWNPAETAIIVCDVWDYHHCLNAVRRLEEFAPRLNDLLTTAREQGVTIIHAPSDCMPAYADHPGRLRAQATPNAQHLPDAIADWCSVIPLEEQAVYPIDQSDGGEDDDPAEHAEWAAKLKALGRNPSLPWGRQSAMITIDGEQDYVSDRGDEIWNILEARNIRNVILTGVHVNMCVLGRPFGLRQMARNGKNVVLMKDMTDTMYNPQRWPYVSHHEGTRRIISHIERYVCSTVTSDQILGGTPFRFHDDNVTASDRPANSAENFKDHWSTATIPIEKPLSTTAAGQVWLRCVVRLPRDWANRGVRIRTSKPGEVLHAWWNGHPLPEVAQQGGGHIDFVAESNSLYPADANLIVLQLNQRVLTSPPILHSGEQQLLLAGRWQARIGVDETFANMPLPAKFGAPTEIVFLPTDTLWTPRALTRIGEFTPGIEGPAGDAQGNIFAVNYQQQGTIGKIHPNGQGEVFVTLPDGSIGNGIRLNSQGELFVADYTGHNILRIDPIARKVSVFAHEAGMSQPNDLAIAADGTLYASDPNWSAGTGQLWRIDVDGTVTKLAENMGTTNGIEVSPDGKTLYINESLQRNIWAWTIGPDRQLSEKRLLKRFEDHGFDGMRCDVDGNLYVTRYGKGTVVKLSPTGEILREIPVLGSKPSNICFGGPDGCTAYVTEVEFTRLVSFRVDRPGLSFQR